MRWLIQIDIFPENEEDLKEVLKDRIIWCRPTINGIEFSESIESDEKFIFYGSIQLGRQLFKRGKVINWLYDQVYDCSYYLHRFGLYALNNPHILTEVGNFEWIRTGILNGERFFVKENSGYKNFTGRIYDDYTQDDIDKLFNEEILLLAAAENIGAEYRFVIATNQLNDKVHRIVTWSPYGDRYEKSEGLVEFVEEVLNEPKVRSYDPAPLWTLDVCKHEDSYKVIEVNSLLSAGWYDCDIAKIVEEVDNASKS